MIERSDAAEQKAVMEIARNMCVAARTAPKAKGLDNLHTCIVTGEDIETLAVEMERLSPILGYGFFMRDAKNIRASQAVVLFGCENKRYELNKGCQLCNHEDCTQNREQNGACIFGLLDLGIAMGSAASLAADCRVDSRIMFSVGRAAMSLKLMGAEISAIFGIPISVSSKSPYFDRKA